MLPHHRLIVVCALAVTGWTSALAAGDLDDRINEYLSACENVLHFNGAVLVKHQGQVLVSRGMGMANFEHEVPNTPQTKFRIGSITKSFTALLTLQQVQASKLSLDDPINKYLIDPPAAWEPITVHHLLSHTSGIVNFTNSLEYLARRSVLGKPDKVVGMFRDKPLRFTPGERFEYSNSAYLLLGQILEEVSGKGYAELMHEQVFEPFAMRDSGYDLSTALIPHRAQGYTRANDVVHNAVFVDMRGVFAAGALFSTVEDLAKYDAGLTAGKLLSAELYEKLYTPVKNDYAYGWVIEPHEGGRYIWHNGGIDGFSANLTRCPEHKTCVVVLSNFDDGQPDRIGRELMSLLFGEEYRLPRVREVTKINTAVYESLVGRYQLSPAMILTITRDGDHLYAQLTRQPRLEVFPESESEFFYKAVDAQLAFAKDSAGKTTHITLYQGGRKLILKRVEDATDDEAAATEE